MKQDLSSHTLIICGICLGFPVGVVFGIANFTTFNAEIASVIGSIIGAIIGIMGVYFGAMYNSKISDKKEQINLATAIQVESQYIIDICNNVVETCEKLNSDKEKKLSVYISKSSDNIYYSNTSKIGTFDGEIVRSIVHFYGLFSNVKDHLERFGVEVSYRKLLITRCNDVIKHGMELNFRLNALVRK